MISLNKRLLTLLLAIAVAASFGCDDEPGDDESQAVEQAVDDAEEGADDDASEEVDRQDDDSEDESGEDDGDDEDDESAEGDDEDGDESGEDDEDDGGEEADDDELSDDEDGAESADFDDARNIEDLDELSADDFQHLPIYATGPVAVVDGEEIGAVQFNIVAEQQLAGVPTGTVQMQSQQIKQMLIQGAIAGHLIEREIDNRDIEVTQAEIDEAIREFEELMESQAGDQLEEMQALMEAQGIDDAALREQAEQQLAAEKLLGDSGQLEVTDSDIRAYYDQNQAQFQQDEPQVRARHILLNVDDHDDGDGDDDEVRQHAQQLADQLDGSSEQFADMAREHSDGPSAPEGGDLGYFVREQLMPEFTDVAFELEPGVVSDPVRSNLGWHVILVEDRRDAGGMSFEEVRDDLEMMLEAEQLQQAAAQLVQQLQQDAQVETHEDNIVVDGG